MMKILALLALLPSISAEDIIRHQSFLQSPLKLPIASLLRKLQQVLPTQRLRRHTPMQKLKKYHNHTPLLLLLLLLRILDRLYGFQTYTMTNTTARPELLFMVENIQAVQDLKKTIATIQILQSFLFMVVVLARI